MSRATGFVPFLGAPAPEGFLARTATLPPGGRLELSDEDDLRLWSGALVVVERGCLEVACRSGARRRFPAGSVLTLAGLPLGGVSLHNPGEVVLVLTALARTATRGGDDPAAGGASHG